MSISIDSEFQSLISPLTDDEYQRLEKSILTEGVREPIITWNDTIIDGHNRYNICQKHGIDCPHVERAFESRDAAKIWICENQLGRRNLEPGQKAALGIERNEAEIREKARLRKFAGKKIDLRVHGPEGTVSEKGTTNEIIAKQVGVSEATVKRVLGVKRKDPELYEKVRSGEVTAREAYRKVTDEKKPQKRKQPQLTDDGRRICCYCGEPIDAGDSYDYEPTIHKKCRWKRSANSQYSNPDKALLNNNPVYTVESLKTELMASAKDLQKTWRESVEINEGMGVGLPDADKKRLEEAARNLIEAVQLI